MTVPGPAGSPPSYAAPGPSGPATAARPVPGPGVVPPFAAPPTEGRTVRLWIGLGVAGLAVLLCLGGGVVAVVGLLLTAGQANQERAEAVIGGYFDALREERYPDAYDLLCDEAQAQVSPEEFAEQASAQPKISSYDIGDAPLTGDLVVPVDVTYVDGQRDTLEVALAPDSTTGGYEVCGVSG